MEAITTITMSNGKKVICKTENMDDPEVFKDTFDIPDSNIGEILEQHIFNIVEKYHSDLESVEINKEYGGD